MAVLNRYDGNTGRFIRVEEPGDGARQTHRAAAPSPPSSSPQPSPPPLPPPQPRRESLLPRALTELLPKTLGELETDDIILLLLLYLMYRESGDSELLIIMGAMFLL